jgi:hypothetical protein
MARKNAQKHPGPSRGSELLAEWCGKKPVGEVCVALGITESAFYAFKAGRGRPGLDRATRIQQATDGAVPATSWLDPATASDDEKPATEAAAS